MDTQDKKRALIIGGTGGIGLELAIHMADNNYQVFVAGRSDLSSLASVHPITHIPWEFKNSQQGLQSLQDALGTDFPIDVLIISFGPYFETSLAHAKIEDWQLLIDSNLTFPGMVTSWVLPSMQKRGYGKIVFFGATGSDQLHGKTRSAIYQTAKTGLSVLAKSLAKEAAKDGISTVVLCPGYTISKSTPPTLQVKAARIVPQGMASEPSDFIPILDAFLLDKKGLMNGAIINCGQGLGN